MGIDYMKQRIVRNRLRELIQERERKINRRIKQHDLAKFAGVTDHTIINWIRNDVTKYDGHIIERLCEYFDCNIEDLLYFEMVEVEDES
jgi:DNA-binding Xre family transcriptional regulator